VTRKHFHLLRVLAWTVQVPVAIVTDLKTSVAYLVFLSLAALIESAGTDYDQARQDEKRTRASGD
jgi:hypothetical protein